MVERLQRELRELRAAAETEVAALRAENATLAAERSEAIEQQAAMQQIMRAIASSPVDVRQVLNEIAEAAARLGPADRVLIHRVEGDAMWAVGHSGPIAPRFSAQLQPPD